MGFRYCPACGRWLDTSEYTVDGHGETVCPKHKATHGFMVGPFPISKRNFLKQHPAYYDDRNEMLAAAREKMLVE